MTSEQQREYEHRLEHIVYDATVRMFEQLESQGLIYGDTHHMAQRLASSAVQLLKKRWVGDRDGCKD